MQYPAGRRRRPICALAIRGAALLACLAIGVAAATPAAVVAPLRVAIVDGSGSDPIAPLAESLAPLFGTPAAIVPRDRADGGLAAKLNAADAVLLVRGPGVSTSGIHVAALREFIERGGGVVVIAAAAEAWPRELPPQELIGATGTGSRFAAGASLTVINLFPHPILTRVERLETKLPVERYDQLADDVQLIAEGTVGEATTPLAWVRQRGNRRLCHVALAGAKLYTDAGYQQLLANALRWTAHRPIPGAQPIVQRTFMPDAYPGAFAVTLPDGPSLCFDPVRGGVSYVWDGDFVDLRPRWLTKEGKPAHFVGEIFYREKEWQPLRAGGAAARGALQFRGYTLRGGEPEFHYEVGGRDVYESFAAAPGGGLIRKFRVGAGSTPLSLQFEAQSASEITTHGLERDGNIAYFSGVSAGEFTIEIRRKALVSP